MTRCTVVALASALLAVPLSAQALRHPSASVGLSYAYYPSEGSVGSGRFGLLGQLSVLSRPRWTVSIEGQYQPLTKDATRFRGFSFLPPPGRFIDQAQTSTRNVVTVGLAATAHTGRHIGFTFAGHLQRFSRHSTIVERDSLGTLLSRSSHSVSAYGPGVQIGILGFLPSMGPLMPRLELRGVVATLESEGRQFYFYPVAAIVAGIGRPRQR
jgi:hypothetical protein